MSLKVDAAFVASNWKSTAQGILTSTLAITGALMVSNHIPARTADIIGTVNIVCKVLIGFYQTDGIQIPPGSKIEQHNSITTPPEESKA